MKSSIKVLRRLGVKQTWSPVPPPGLCNLTRSFAYMMSPVGFLYSRVFLTSCTIAVNFYLFKILFNFLLKVVIFMHLSVMDSLLSDSSHPRAPLFSSLSLSLSQKDRQIEKKSKNKTAN
ncbi:mCG147958 [Mus musculus]|nr:mCG147958 [Mus musculus]